MDDFSRKWVFLDFPAFEFSRVLKLLIIFGHSWVSTNFWGNPNENFEIKNFETQKYVVLLLLHNYNEAQS